MTTQRQEPAEVYPTRRSIREAERRAEALARQGAGGPDAGSRGRAEITIEEPLHSRPASAALVPSAFGGPVTPARGVFKSVSGWATETGHVPPVPAPIIPEDVDLSATPRRGNRWVPRLAILGSLAAATTVVPLTGPPTSSAAADEGVQYGATDVLDVLMDDSSQYGTDSPTPGALGADPLAGVRAAVTASRSEDRSGVMCGNLAATANGSAAAEVASRPLEVVMPLAEGTYRLTSRYGYRSMWGRYSQHTGVDMAAPAGTPIHAVADGVVEYAGPGKDGRSSMLIIIRHNVNGQVIRTWYVHMYSNGVYASPGQQVSAGDVIGAVGSNGNSTGPHLHLEVHTDNNLTTVDPLVWLTNNGAVKLNQETQECLPS